jgi:hypothetical protein
MDSVVIQPIFWGPSWANASFAADKMTGLGTFYAGFANSDYARTNVEYTGLSVSSGTMVGVTATQVDVTAKAIVDSATPTPHSAPRTSAVLAEVCAQIKNPVPNGYYPVYTDIPRGHAGYCAWHSWAACGGVNVQFGFFFALDNDPGCNPGDTTAGRSEGLAALANVSGHELSETLTDPRGTGWLDRSGNENADKCAWQFPDTDESFTTTDPVTMQPVVTTWKIQGNWSNKAYDGSAGTPRGCIYAVTP